MNAAFSLSNMSFDTSDFPDNLFTVDEQYKRQRAQGDGRGPGLIQIISPNRPSAHTLDEIYKLCKTDEDYNDDEEDSESLERANELFNSMLKKGMN